MGDYGRSFIVHRANLTSGFEFKLLVKINESPYGAVGVDHEIGLF